MINLTMTKLPPPGGCCQFVEMPKPSEEARHLRTFELNVAKLPRPRLWPLSNLWIRLNDDKRIFKNTTEEWRTVASFVEIWKNSPGPKPYSVCFTIIKWFKYPRTKDQNRGRHLTCSCLVIFELDDDQQEHQRCHPPFFCVLEQNDLRTDPRVPLPRTTWKKEH